MTQSSGPAHVYIREIKAGEWTSLSVLAGMVPEGSTVLDLGTGSGALGQFLQADKGCVVDGVTYNPAERDHAGAAYRRIEVADLDRCELAAMFHGTRYDRIVCADVLEHLKHPERVLEACRQLLAPSGAVLVSVPNAAYAGLIAELMSGEFRYRDEGLLDRTHLRFFTRRSLVRFMQEEGWSVASVDSVERPLPASEFRVAFDRLPPAVSRYLVGVPDSTTYQLVAALRPASPGAAPSAPATALLAGADEGQALFTLQLYLGEGGTFSEERKLSATGVIGVARQTVRFAFTPDRPCDGLRLDPADRPGFIHLHRMALQDANGTVHWEWRHDRDGLRALDEASHHGVLVAPAAPLVPGGLLLLYGDDPWINLPLDAAAKAWLGEASSPAVLEVELGWPMSADYLSMAAPLAAHARDLAHRTEEAVREAAETTARQQATFEEILERERRESREAVAQAEAAAAESARAAFEQAERQAERQQFLEARNRLLQVQQRNLTLHTSHLSLQKAQAESERDQLHTHLRWIENSTIFRATRPLVRLKMRLQQGWRPAGEPAVELAPRKGTPIAAPEQPVDVIVPVYRGLADTRRCIESVLSQACTTPMRLVVINDASPEPELAAWLRDAASREPRITLLENAENLGFVGTVNRGMALSEQHDVLLLNSDTQVANDWLDRIRRAAYSDHHVASVTPFSNNATICSYPRFCADNALPPDHDVASLDALFRRLNEGYAVDVPTGVGFCMYIRRDALRAVGLFDVETFGKGYGEENDFCRRAAAAGWRNLHALDTFVLHSGGVSFGDAKSPREAAAMETLRRLYPDYEPAVHRFVSDDPARLARLAVDGARIGLDSRPVVLMVAHDRAGGTLRHVQELAERLGDQGRFLMLTPTPGGNVRLELLGPSEGFALLFQLPDEFDQLVQAAQALGVRHVHYHHFIGHGAEVRTLPQRLGTVYDFTAHDFYTMCPQISLTGRDNAYCGETGEGQCTHCRPTAAAPGGMDIAAWRAEHGSFVANARHVLVPSRDAARRFARLLPQADIRLAPHLDLDGVELPAPVARALPHGEPLKVVVLGALSAIKGADVLDAVAKAAAQRGAPVEFHLLGYAYRHLKTQPDSALTVHGAYADDDLPRLLAWLKPHVAWFPAQWPETYSYTLSACLLHGVPVVAPSIGAFAERLQGRAWSWVRPWDESPADTLAFFEDIRLRHFATGNGPTRSFAVLPADGADAVIGRWNYRTEYFEDLPAPRRESDPRPLSLDFLAHHHADRTHGAVAHLRRGLKRRVLGSLLRVRSAPGLSGLARAVPLRWQTRVKTWLRA